MDDIHYILIVICFSYLLEYLKIQFDLSMCNVLLFINLISVYFLIKKIKFSFKIEYNQ